jgi:hypothetical protein
MFAHGAEVPERAESLPEGNAAVSASIADPELARMGFEIRDSITCCAERFGRFCSEQNSLIVNNTAPKSSHSYILR